MKISKETLIKIIQEELQTVFEQEEEQQSEPKKSGPDDKTGKRAGSSAVQAADEVVDGMIEKAASLGPRLKQLRTTDQRKLALTRSLLTKVVQMDGAQIDKMLQLIIQGLK